MNNVVIVGAGKEGKGTFGDIFNENNWNITFLDKDESVINQLNSKGKYEVEALYVDHTELHDIMNYKAYLINKTLDYLDCIVDADVIVLALYPEDILNSLDYLSVGLKERAKNNSEKKLTILCGTNKNHMIKGIENYILNTLKIDNLWYEKNVALRDMIIRRSSNASSTDATELTSKAVQTLLIQSPVYFAADEFRWFELCKNLEMMKDIKLYTYNSPHAACAYVGYNFGYKTIEDASKNPTIKKIMDGCIDEAKHGILQKFPISKEELDKFVDAPKPLGEETEYITRVAFDPIRKLARYDRLTGIAMICLENNIECPNLIKAIAYGMKYDYSGDPSAIEIQNFIKNDGLKIAISKVIGVEVNHKIIDAVAVEYENIKPSID